MQQENQQPKLNDNFLRGILAQGSWQGSPQPIKQETTSQVPAAALQTPQQNAQTPVSTGSPTEDKDDKEPSKKKRKRYHAKKACAYCRKAHTACDDERPCKRCKKKGLQCFDADSEAPEPPTQHIQSQQMFVNGIPYDPQMVFPKPTPGVQQQNWTSSQRPLPGGASAAQSMPQPTIMTHFAPINSQQQPNTAAPFPPTLPQPQSFSPPSQSSAFNSMPPAPQPTFPTGNGGQVKTEIQHLREISKKQEAMLQQCTQQLLELQSVISKQSEVLSQLSQSSSSLSLYASQNPASPVWFKLPAQLTQPVSMWDKKKLMLIGCNEAFKSMAEYDPDALTNEFKFLAFTPARSASYIEVLLFALLNSGAKYAELKSVWTVKSGKEIYLKHKFHIEESFFWVEHESQSIIDDEYRIDEYIHKKTFESPFDPNASKRIMPPSNKIYAFLEVLNKVTEQKKLRVISLNANDGSQSMMGPTAPTPNQLPPPQMQPPAPQQQMQQQSMDNSNPYGASRVNDTYRPMNYDNERDY